MGRASLIKSMRLSIAVAMAVLAIAVGVVLALPFGSPAIELAWAAGPIAIGPGTPVAVQYASAPGNVAPSIRDVTRRTAVFPGLVEVKVLHIYLVGSDSDHQLVVDLVLQSLRPSTIIPTQELRFELRDAKGVMANGLTVSRPLDQPLRAGDEQRYQLRWNAPTTGTANFDIALSTGANAATFAIKLGGALQ